MEAEAQYKIDDILIQRFKKISHLRATPHGKHMFLIGKNGVGKTSVLDAILAVLTGKDLPPEMVTQGERDGEIEVILKDETKDISWNCVLTFGTKRKLEIRPIMPDGKQGKPIASPRDFLDDLIGKIEKTHTIAFDPFAFLRMTADKQLKAIKDLCGVNWEVQDKEYKEVYDRRTLIGQQIEAIEGFITKSDILPHEYKIFDKPKPIDEIKLEISNVEAHMKKRNELLAEQTKIGGDLERGESATNTTLSRIQFINTLITNTSFINDEAIKTAGVLKEFVSQQPMPDVVDNMLIAVEKIIAEHKRLHDILGKDSEELEKIKVAVQALNEKKTIITEQLELYPEKSSSELNDRLEKSINFNQKVEKVNGLKAQQIELEDKKLLKLQCTQQLEDIKKEKLEMLPDKMPATGMTIDVENDQLMLDGLPFESKQINTSRIMRAGFDMLMSMNPQIRTFCVRDASLLDDETLQTVIDYANELGFQGFFEVVDRKQPVLSYEIHELCEEYLEGKDSV